MRNASVALILVLAAMAGCVSSKADGAPNETAPGPGAGPAGFGDDTGAIEGMVTDEEIRPIPNAIVGLLKSDVIQTEIVATTDELGKFGLSNVPPGEHILSVQALGFESTAQRVTVVVGEAMEVNVVLKALAADGPYKLEYIVKGRMGYGVAYKLTPTCIYEPLTTVNPSLKTCGGLRSGDHANGEIGLGNTKSARGAGDVLPNWATIQIELVWTQQTPVVGRSLQLDILFPNITRGTTGAANQADPRYFQNPDYDSPVVLRIDRPIMDERKIAPDDQYGDVRARVFTAAADLGTWRTAPDVGIMHEQTFTYHVAIAFDEPLEAAYSGLPDG